MANGVIRPPDTAAEFTLLFMAIGNISEREQIP